MLKSGPGNPRPSRGPQPRDFLSARPPKAEAAPEAEGASDGVPQGEAERAETSKQTQFLRSDGKSRRPEPRIPGKHALNPPIVTIFGAGVAGLTAAHELLDRGFIVQVIEKEEDPSCPGRPHIGGLAANQPARVRANIEDLHANLITTSLAPLPAGASQSAKNVASWLLEMFAFNRSRWIQTEVPATINTNIFSASSSDAGAPFRGKLITSLMTARDGYMQRWLWDLLGRGVLLGAITPKTAGASKAATGPAAEPSAASPSYAEAKKTVEGLSALDSLEIAVKLTGFLEADQTVAGRTIPTETQLRALAPVVRQALEREFLCFRLIPYARRGFPAGAAQANTLYNDWVAVFQSDPILRSCCLSCPTNVDADGILRAADGTPVAIREGDASPEFPHLAWLDLEIVEQRLPGEHGYRFFPSFYRHLEDTMARIPLYAEGSTTSRKVRDNLIPTVFQGIGLSDDDERWIVEHSHDARRSYLEKEDPTQRDKRPPRYEDPDGAACKASPAARGTIVELDRELPRSVEALRNCTDRFVRRVGGTRRDAVILLAKLVRYLTSSPERRRREYEGMNWSTFVGIEKFSEVMRFHIQSAAQSLLAFSAAEADARTYGNIALQMMLDELRDGTRVDRTLNGPTSDAWLEPWREHLERQGVRFFHGTLTGLEWRDVTNGPGKTGRELVPVVSMKDEKDGVSSQGLSLLSAAGDEPALHPDFYVLALNVESSRHLVQKLEEQEAAKKEGRWEKEARDFAALAKFGRAIEEKQARKNMTGLQYFFDAKTAIGRGHLYFPFSKWGLSSISQSEFWSVRGGFADGYFGLLSVDVCTTDAPKRHTLGAPTTGLDSFTGRLGAGGPEGALDVAQRALEQIGPRIGVDRALSAPRCFHIDRNSLEDKELTPRFLASMTGLDETRPGRRAGNCVGPREIEYELNFERWVMCGTFMATHTRMTTMESANESARHAVAAILRRLQRSDAASDLEAATSESEYQIENLVNKDYNWASRYRTYEAPQTWNPEDDEIPDLDFLRRVDRRLVDIEVPHFMDIINFDRKLEHALDAVDIYGQERPLSEVFGLSAANLDAAFTRELGPGYHELEERRHAEAQSAPASGRFPDMASLENRLKEVFDVFSNLIRPTRSVPVATVGGGGADVRRK
jgi:hypothetical protein